MQKDTPTPTLERAKRTRLKLTERETSTRKGEGATVALVSYKPNNITDSFKVLRVY
jgi:hypothetical protein